MDEALSFEAQQLVRRGGLADAGGDRDLANRFPEQVGFREDCEDELMARDASRALACDVAVGLFAFDVTKQAAPRCELDVAVSDGVGVAQVVLGEVWPILLGT
jgi:hypothetical protein